MSLQIGKDGIQKRKEAVKRKVGERSITKGWERINIK